MNVGQQTIEWLYTTQLQIDDEWAVREPNGFTWWAYLNAQTIEILGGLPKSQRLRNTSDHHRHGGVNTSEKPFGEPGTGRGMGRLKVSEERK